MPGLIGERLCTLFDTDGDGFLKKDEFIKGILRLFATTFEDTARLIFDLCDFDRDGKVSKEDFRMLLSHVPLLNILELINVPKKSEGAYTKRGGGMNLFLDRLQSQEEIAKLVDKCLKDRAALTFPEFVRMTEEKSSTIYLCVSFYFIHAVTQRTELFTQYVRFSCC